MTQFSWPEIRLINAKMLAANEFSPEKFSQRVFFAPSPISKVKLSSKENTQYYLASFNCFVLVDFEIGSIAFSIVFFGLLFLLKYLLKVY